MQSRYAEKNHFDKTRFLIGFNRFIQSHVAPSVTNMGDYMQQAWEIKQSREGITKIQATSYGENHLLSTILNKYKISLHDK